MLTSPLSTKSLGRDLRGNSGDKIPQSIKLRSSEDFFGKCSVTGKRAFATGELQPGPENEVLPVVDAENVNMRKG